MKKVLTFLFLLVIGLLLFYFVIKWVGWGEIKQVLFDFSGPKGIVILIATVLIWLAGIWRWQFILGSQGRKVSFLKLGEIFFAGATINYFFSPPAYFGDELFRVYAAKKRFDLTYEENISAIVIEKILSASAILFFSILGIIALIVLAKLPFENVLTTAFVVILTLAFGLFIFYFRSFQKKSIIKYFSRFIKEKNGKDKSAIKNVEDRVFLFFDFRKSLMWKGLGFGFLRYSLVFLRCWLLVFFLTGEINLLISAVILCSLFVATILPFPARVGGLEISQAFAFGILGLGKAVGITFSIIIRGVEILIAFFGLALLIKLTMKFSLEKVENISNKVNNIIKQ